MGTVYLVGAGPGDEGLITVKGVRLLEQADVVLYDKLVNRAILRHARKAKLIGAGVHGTRDRMEQDEINRLLEKFAKQGKTVVRLKGGDPIIFGRGGEEAEFLARRGIPFEIVPAPTAASVTAYAGIPLTHRDLAYKITLVTGQRKGDSEEVDLSDVPRDGTIVIYMGLRTLPKIAGQLIDLGWDPETPAAVVQWASLGIQKVVDGTLRDISERVKQAGFMSPTIAVVGKVVALRTLLSWYEKKPLFGQTVVLTRPEELAGGLIERLSDLGAHVLLMPSIEIRPLPTGPLDRELKKISTYTWVMFTSRNAARIFLERVGDLRRLHSVKVAAIGPATAAQFQGLVPDLVSKESTTDALGKTLLKKIGKGDRILYPCAEVHNTEMVRALRDKGAEVKEVVVYRIVRRPLDLSGFDRATVLTFASALTAEHFLSQLDGTTRDVLKRCKIVCIGPVTAERVGELGYTVHGVARRHDADGLVEAILNAR